MNGLIVFLGPSLEMRAAREIIRAEFWPPARQGDVFRALVKQPRAIALIDGVFEGAPSVWHHELRAALAAGVTVFGASSMGALRAVELQDEGMIGIGKIFEGYASGALTDDGDVALLHADKSHGFKPMTLPLVNVMATIEKAQEQGVLTAREAGRVLKTARAIFYQDRRWSSVLEKIGRQTRGFEEWLAMPGHEVDQKALDARACLEAAKTFVTSAAPSPAPKPFTASSFVRRRRLMNAHPKRVQKLQQRPDAHELETEGAKRLLLAAFAKAGGLTVTPAERQTARRGLTNTGLAADEREWVAEVLALEAKILAAPERFVADGPSRLEGLALEAVVRGEWK